MDQTAFPECILQWGSITLKIYYNSNMKSIKLDAEALEKAQQYSQPSSIQNLRDLRKKHGSQLKAKPFELEPSKIETRNNSPRKKSQDESDNLLSEFKNNIEKANTAEELNGESRGSLRLPAINPRRSKKMSMDNSNDVHDDQPESQDLVKQGKYTSQGIIAQSKARPIPNSKNNLTENEEGDNLASFLKYIQIRPMKPAEKVAAPKNDMSVREFKMARNDKSIPLKLGKNIERDESPALDEKKSAESKLRPRRNMDKSEKVISNSTIRKEKRALSITHNNTQQVRQKKMYTNTYYDFCNFVCALNKVQRPTTPSGTYKAYVAKGNNSILVKNSLKSRFWWNIVDSDTEINLFWSQARDTKFVETLKCYEPEKEARTDQSSEKKVLEFSLPRDARENNDKNELIREYTHNGLNKFLSAEERKQYSKNPLQVELPSPPAGLELGNPNRSRIHNHLEFHWHISNKKALYYNLKKYYNAMKEDPFQYIPLTFHIQKHGDEEWMRFVEAYNERSEDLKKRKEKEKENGDKAAKKKKQKNLWIVKPGQNSNQGNGIQVFDNIDEIAQMVKTSGERPNGRQRSYIVQRYLMPFLYNKRKFDIRCYVLVTCIKGVYKAYWYEQGYIRTSSKQFTLKNLKNRFIHLTNDAVQKKSEDYGKYENGNKISFADFQKHLDTAYPEKEYRFYKTVYPSMIKRASDAIKSTCMLMDAKKREFSFEIFGLDFMIDEDFATWLIEVNTNPCLELSSPLLARIIPNMVENALKIAVDPIFPPPRDVPKTRALPTDIFESNKFTLIFNSSEDQEVLANLTKDTNLANIVESDEEDDNHDDVQ